MEDDRVKPMAGAEGSGGPEDRKHRPLETDDVQDKDQPSALGGDVATRSGTAPTPEQERTS